MPRSRKTSRGALMSEIAVAAPAVSLAIVSRSEQVARDIRVIALDIPSPATVPSPGQFYQVDCGGGREHILPRPIAAMDARSSGEALTLAFMVEAVGWGTRRLCSLVEGDRLSVLGPLGRGFSGHKDGKSMLVAGGIGFAPLHFLASTMDREGMSYLMMAGVSSKDRLPAPLATLSGDVEVFSDDGSAGESGLVCHHATFRLDSGEFTKVFTCGPEAMMAEVARASEERGISCEVSLDSRMACGIGACRGCVKTGARGKKICVCTDGPVFNSRDVEWKEA
jgi:dihydroorotate dehydrogenase electron transfer subunit